MTVQIKERIYHKGELKYTSSYPLEEFFEKSDKVDKPKKIGFSTACRRGYVGTWEIRDSELYLIDLRDGFPDFDQRDCIDTIFPNQKEVFAEWFSGDIIIPYGEVLYSIFYGPDIYEEDHILKFQEGYLIDVKIVDNYEYAAETRESMKKIYDDASKPKKPLKGLRKILQKWLIKRAMSNLVKSK